MDKQIKLNIGYSSDIATICEPLKQFGITSFNFVRTYQDGSQINLCNIGEWLDHFYSRQYYKQGAFEHSPQSYESGYALWPSLSGQTIFYDARHYFNIDNGITVIEKSHNYCEFYFFGSTKGNSQIINFYLNHIDLLKRFIMYFKSSAITIINETSKNRIIIPDHFKRVTSVSPRDKISSQDSVMSNFIQATKIKEYHLSGELNGVILTNREMDCAISLLEGKSAPEIAKVLFISPRTVETHLTHIKDKLDCRTKSELIIKLLSNGFEIYGNKSSALLGSLKKISGLSMVKNDGAIIAK